MWMDGAAAVGSPPFNQVHSISLYYMYDSSEHIVCFSILFIVASAEDLMVPGVCERPTCPYGVEEGGVSLFLLW